MRPNRVTSNHVTSHLFNAGQAPSGMAYNNRKEHKCAYPVRETMWNEPVLNSTPTPDVLTHHHDAVFTTPPQRLTHHP